MIPTEITRTSPFSGKVNVMTITLNPADLADYESGNGLIQQKLGYLTADEREFIMTGITATEWENTFS